MTPDAPTDWLALADEHLATLDRDAARLALARLRAAGEEDDATPALVARPAGAT